MAQTVQIVPKYSFPYVETHINDYTHLSDEASSSSNIFDDTVRFVFAFIGSKGLDNTWVKKTTESNFITAFGKSNYKRYGQPIMMPLSLLAQGNCEVWCMRVMPENAAYAHAIVSLYYKADDTSVDVTKRKFRIKLVAKYADDATPLTSSDDVIALRNKEDAGLTSGKDSEGYTWAPYLASYSNGRGKYGNDYRLRVIQNTNYEKEYKIKEYTYEVLSTDGGLQKTATYIGGNVTSSKFSSASLINDILNDTETGIAPVIINVDEDSLATVYDAYVAFCNQLAADAEAAMESASEEDKKNKYLEIWTEAANPVDMDEFDFLYGRSVASATEMIPFVTFPTSVSADEYSELESDDSVDISDYTQTATVTLDTVTGLKLKGGSDGYFDKPRLYKYTDETTGKEVSEQWDLDKEVEMAYIKAYSGDLDARILTPKRIQANAFFDANYSMAVKNTLAELTLLRDDAILYMDTGIINSFNDIELDKMITNFNSFDSRLISKNCQHYQVTESGTNKRVNVTITYFLANQYANHIKQYGPHIPMVKAQCQLSGHVKDSLHPTVEDYEVDLKETLCTNHFNYFETVDDNLFQRATQSTSQKSESDLTEESNVTTLYTMKRITERVIGDDLYDFSDQDERAAFRDYMKAIFSDWIGSRVQSFDIEFDMNDFEAERSILHAYIAVTFRGIYKRAIVEIDINKRNTKTTETTETSSALLLS